jgi:aspartate racemase
LRPTVYDRPTIGVIGGLGPAATADFYARVVAATPAQTDQDHLHLIIDSDPSVPNRNDAIAGRGPSSGPALAATARRLHAAGADVLVMPCNTAHAFLPDIQGATPLPLLSIIDATVDAAVAAVPDLQLVSLLAAEGCLQARLFQDAFEARGVRVLAPEGPELAAFMVAVYAIKGGGGVSAAYDTMRGLAMRHIQAGAQAVIAGCTEVPMVLQPDDLPCPLISSTDALVDAVIAYGTNRTRTHNS